MSGRAKDRIALVEAYSKAQDMWRTGDGSDLVFTDTLELDLGDVVPSMAGPKRPEGRLPLETIAPNFATALENDYKKPASFRAATLSKARTLILVTAMWRLPPSPPAPTRPILRPHRGRPSCRNAVAKD